MVLTITFHLFVCVILSYCLWLDAKPPKGSEFEKVFHAFGHRFKFLTFLNMGFSLFFTMLLVLFHLITGITLVITVHQFENVITPPPDTVFDLMLNGFARRYKYLTHLNLLLHCGYYAIAIINDVIGTNERYPKKQSIVQRVRDWLFTSLVFPLGCFVTFIFWTLYLVDRELILPKSMDAWFPSWVNHTMHTLPAIAAVIEQIVLYHKHQRGYGRLMPIFVAYIFYLTWLIYIRQRAGFWVYPVFEALSDRGRTVFVLALSLPALLFYVIGEKLHVTVWGLDDVREPKKSSKKSK